MKNYVILGLIILCLILGFGLFYFWDQNRDQKVRADLAESQSAVKLRDANTRIGLRDSAVARLQSEMDSAAQIHTKRQESNLRSLIASRSRERLTRQNPTVMTLTDTVYMSYDSLIEDLTIERDAIRHDCKVLVDSLLANANDYKTIIGIKNEQITSAQNQTEKEKKGKKFWKVMAIIGFAIAAEEAIRN